MDEGRSYKGENGGSNYEVTEDTSKKKKGFSDNFLVQLLFKTQLQVGHRAKCLYVLSIVIHTIAL